MRDIILLVIEYDEDVGNLVNRVFSAVVSALNGSSKITPITAKTLTKAEAAIANLSKSAGDKIVFLDANLGSAELKTDTIPLFKKIKEQYPDTVVIGMSATPDLLDELEKAGCDYTLSKPFTVRDIQDILSEILSG